MRRVGAAALTAVLVGALAQPAEASGSTWYVRGGATTTAGTSSQPFGTWRQVEKASRPGDTIVVKSSATPLDGGLRLKRDQTVRGAGRSVLGTTGSGPVVTNTTDRLDGDAIRLADGATVTNLRLVGRAVARSTVSTSRGCGSPATTSAGRTVRAYRAS